MVYLIVPLYRILGCPNNDNHSHFLDKVYAIDGGMSSFMFSASGQSAPRITVAGWPSLEPAQGEQQNGEHTQLQCLFDGSQTFVLPLFAEQQAVPEVGIPHGGVGCSGLAQQHMGLFVLSL